MQILEEKHARPMGQPIQGSWSSGLSLSLQEYCAFLIIYLTVYNNSLFFIMLFTFSSVLFIIPAYNWQSLAIYPIFIFFPFLINGNTNLFGTTMYLVVRTYCDILKKCPHPLKENKNQALTLETGTVILVGKKYFQM